MVKKYREGGSSDKEPVRSGFMTRMIRGLTPLPLPAAQLLASTITGDTRFGFEDAPEDVRDELAKSVINARRRTGSNRGGTQYIDFSEAIDKDINNLDVSMKDAVLGSTIAPDFRAATTFGRVSYEYEPDTDTYYIYDSYDFSETPGKDTAYSKVRKGAGKMGPKEGKANLVGTFKGSDYQDFNSSEQYKEVKKGLSQYFGDMPTGTAKFEQGGKVMKYRKGGKSKVNEAGNYTKPGMRKRIFNRIKAGTKGGNAGQWSARKAQMLAKAYKAAGGGYKN